MTTTTTYYSLQVAGREVGTFAATDPSLRETVDGLANGDAWGWRSCPDGMEAVCDHVVIALAVPLDA